MEGLFYALLGLAFLAFFIYIWWQIFTKAGYPGIYGVLMLVPVANIVLILILAFGEWPIYKKYGIKQASK